MLASKTIVYLLYFCIYSTLLLIVEKMRLQENDTLRHFYLGGRNLNLLSCTLAFVGTWISAATILGFTGNVFESGYAPVMYSVIPWIFGALLLCFISGRLYDNDVLTIPELFAKRYQSKWLQAAAGVPPADAPPGGDQHQRAGGSMSNFLLGFFMLYPYYYQVLNILHIFLRAVDSYKKETAKTVSFLRYPLIRCRQRLEHLFAGEKLLYLIQSFAEALEVDDFPLAQEAQGVDHPGIVA